MNTFILWIILFIFVLDMCVNANSFSYDQAYHTEKKTWKAASDECGGDGLEFDDTVLTRIAMLYDKEFWIGMSIFRVATSWIEVLGCYAVPEVQKVTKSSSIVLCQKQCVSYQFFGYSELTETCLCKHSKSSSFYISACINNNDSKYVFLYKVFTGHVSHNGDGKCTTLSCTTDSNGLTSADCDDTADSSRISRCNDGHIISWGIPYSRSKQMCLERFQLLLSPETYCQMNIHEEEGIRSWTNVFRAETEVELTKVEAGTKQPLYCLSGAFTGNNTNRVLNVIRRYCNDQLEFVCRIGNASSPTQSQSTRVTRTLQKGVVICEVLGACSMVIVLVVLIVCKVRSKGIFTESNTQHYEDTSRVKFSSSAYEDLNNTKHTNLTATTNQTFEIDESSAPVYEEVNKN